MYERYPHLKDYLPPTLYEPGSDKPGPAWRGDERVSGLNQTLFGMWPQFGSNKIFAAYHADEPSQHLPGRHFGVVLWYWNDKLGKIELLGNPCFERLDSGQRRLFVDEQRIAKWLAEHNLYDERVYRRTLEGETAFDREMAEKKAEAEAASSERIRACGEAGIEIASMGGGKSKASRERTKKKIIEKYDLTTEE